MGSLLCFHSCHGYFERDAVQVCIYFSKIRSHDATGTLYYTLTKARAPNHDSHDGMGKFTPVTTTYSIEDSVPHGTILIVIGTPGMLTDLIRKQNINSKQIKIFMVDEAENMLGQQGLGDQTLQVKKCTHPTSWGAGVGSLLFQSGSL